MTLRVSSVSQAAGVKLRARPGGLAGTGKARRFPPSGPLCVKKRGSDPPFLTCTPILFSLSFDSKACGARYIFQRGIFPPREDLEKRTL